jgi:hypothetical protein
VEIDAALVAPNTSFRRLEKRYGISRTSLMRHKEHHLSPALVAVHKARVVEGSARAILDELREVAERQEEIYLAAHRVRNAQQALDALKAKRQTLELVARITGELDERPQVTVNLQQTTQWIDVRTIVFEELRSHPEVARRIATKLRVLDGKS